MTDISIIILSWNTARITQKCVESILKVKSKINYEIIVVDNGSEDDTVKILQQYPQIKLIENHTNLGFSKGNNIGASHASGKYLFFLNSDMEILSDLKPIIKYLNRHPRVGALGPKFLNIDLSWQGSVFPPQTPLNAYKEFWLNQSTFSKYSPDTKKPLSVWSISGGAIIISRKIFKNIGGWDERYYFYFEDLEICRQIRLQKYQIIYYPGYSVIHRHGASVQRISQKNESFDRLVKGSLLYHGLFKHFVINSIIWSGQKWRKLLSIILK